MSVSRTGDSDVAVENGMNDFDDLVQQQLTVTTKQGSSMADGTKQRYVGTTLIDPVSESEELKRGQVAELKGIYFQGGSARFKDEDGLGTETAAGDHETFGILTKDGTDTTVDTTINDTLERQDADGDGAQSDIVEQRPTSGAMLWFSECGYTADFADSASGIGGGGAPGQHQPFARDFTAGGSGLGPLVYWDSSEKIAVQQAFRIENNDDLQVKVKFGVELMWDIHELSDEALETMTDVRGLGR